MKFAGMLLLLLASTGAGCLAAGKLRSERLALELLSAWTSDAEACIRYTNAELPELLGMLESMGFRFAGEIMSQLSPMTPPQTLWQTAVERDAEVPPSAKPILRRLGTSLGTTDTEGQLAALILCREQLRNAAGDAAEACRVKGRLCRVLGILGGLALGVLVW